MKLLLLLPLLCFLYPEVLAHDENKAVFNQTWATRVNWSLDSIDREEARSYYSCQFEISPGC